MSRLRIEFELKEELKRYNQWCRSTGGKGPNLEFMIYTFRSGPRQFENAVEIFRSALMIIGPHGGQMSNVMYTRPGTTVVEFITVDATTDINISSKNDPSFLKTIKQNAKGQNKCRTCLYSMSMAVGNPYWVVEPQQFNFYTASEDTRLDMVPNLPDLVTIVQSVLHQHQCGRGLDEFGNPR